MMDDKSCTFIHYHAFFMWIKITFILHLHFLHCFICLEYVEALQA
jgi:hypothetical protein